MADQENPAPKSGVQKKRTIRQQAVNHIKVKCTDKIANLANLIACGVLAVAAVFRLIHCFSVEFNLFFFIMTFYFISFIAIISFAEILYLRPDNE